MAQVNNPYQYVPDPTVGRPLALGQMFFGIAGLDPEVGVNQIQVRIKQEDGTLVNVSQPILTSAGGVPEFNGSPVILDVAETVFSLKYLNSQGTQVYYQEQNSPLDVAAASESEAGVIQIATQTEVDNGVNDTKAVTPLKLQTKLDATVVDATETERGIIELATQAEVDAGTDTEKAVTPATLAGSTLTEINWLDAETSVASLDISPSVPNRYVRLNDTDICMSINPGTDSELRTYRRSGGATAAWAQEGNTFTIPDSSGAVNGLCQLNETDVAVMFWDASAGSERIGRYRFNGTDWNIVGNLLDVSGQRGSITALNEDLIVFGDITGGPQLEAYEFISPNWSPTGTPFVVDDVNGLTTLSSEQFAFVDRVNNELNAASFNGSIFAIEGNPFDIGVNADTVAALNSSDVATHDSGPDELLLYRFNQTDWAPIGIPVPVGASGSSDYLSAINGREIMFRDPVSGDVDTYRYDFYID